MKTKALTLIFFLQLLFVTTFAQKNAGLGTLLNKNAEFIFPQTPEKISVVLKVKPIFTEDASEEQNAKWITKSGLALYGTLGNNRSINEIWFDIPDDKFLIISGLPYHLTLNQTTVQEALVKFKKNKVKKTMPEMYGALEGGTELEVKIGNRYVTLFFDRKNLLKSASILLGFIDPAAG
ncbi:hypothetical protein GJU39_14135 [Pedobacter petrophilus]|uniref:DUF4251 domain-containing protein n=1 Tax=Pedobacter petrophilus TaxID=1908241 RepID=A0A7K0G0B8_9SPHI|nr:hypothetical protein [Pedobacter petrophilus]MRX77225.1 hypothetical protein [Pedobacter petrophilus]